MARGASETRKQPVSTGSARHGNSANLETCEREHHGNVIHQDRRCSQGDDYAGNSIAEANTIQKDTIGTPSGNSDVEPSTVQKRLSDWDCKELAEREGFKPSVQELARTTA